MTFRKVTPSAKSAKDHFVIVDAIGVTRSLKTDSRPLEKKPGVPLKELLSSSSSRCKGRRIIYDSGRQTCKIG